MSDLIDRQAAIDSFRYDDDGTAWNMDDIVYRLEQFPSVQPEIVRCRDCKEYYANDHRCRWWNHGTKEAGWCYVAERMEE